MTDDRGMGGKLNVFISYSRDDLGFADQLDATLELAGFATSIDRHGISGGEDWKRRLGNLIRNSDTVVFVLSPTSAASDICRWEVEEAARHNKRIIPILPCPLREESPPQKLQDLNYIFFYPEPKSPGSGFGAGLRGLVSALNSDFDWLREHTRLLQRATEWDTAGRPSNRLLSGADIDAAKSWLAQRPKEAPAPTALHLDFIRASEEWDTRQKNEARRQLEERERLVQEAEVAQKERNAAAQRVVQRTLIGLVVALLLAAVAGAATIYALSRQRIAIAQAAAAEAATKEALLAQSRYLTGLADQALKDGDAATGMLLALEALPDPASEDKLKREKPFWGLAAVSLDSAHRGLREHSIIRGHEDVVSSVAVSPDGRRIVTDSDDKTARVWDAKTFAELATLKGHTGLVSSVALSSDGSHIVTGSSDKTARVWDAKTFAELATLKGHEQAVSSVAVSPDGSRIFTGSDDMTARVWDAETFTNLATLEGHTERITSVAVSPDGSRIVTGSDDNTARVWDARTGHPLAVLTGHAEIFQRVLGGSGKLTGIMAYSDPTESIWQTQGWRGGGCSRGICGVAVMPDDLRVVTGSGDHTARIWAMNQQTDIAVLNGFQGNVSILSATPDGSHVVSGHWRTSDARVWERDSVTGSWAVAAVLEHPSSAQGNEAVVQAVAITGDGSRVVTGAAGESARVWDGRTGKLLFELNGHELGVWSTAVTPDGSRIVTGSGNGEARIWDGHSGTLLHHHIGHGGPGRGVNSVAISADGIRIVTGSDDKTALIWDGRRGVPLTELVGHTYDVRSVAITPDGNLVLTGSGDGTVRVWNGMTGALLTILLAHEASIVGVAVASDGRRIVTGSDDNTVRVWDRKLEQGANEWEMVSVVKTNPHRIESMTIGLNATRVFTALSDKTIRIWGPAEDNAALLALAKAAVPRHLTAAQRQRYYLSPQSPGWCSALAKWPYDPLSNRLASVRLLAVGKRLLSELKDEEAGAQFALALQRDPAAAKKIDELWADAYVSRGAEVLAGGKDGEAKAQFELALKRNPDVAEAIAVALVNMGGERLEVAPRANEKEAQIAKQTTLNLFNHAVNWAQRKGVDKEVLTRAMVGRGRAHVAKGEYQEAIKDFRSAEQLGSDATKELFHATLGLSAAKETEEPAGALVIAMAHMLDLSPEARERIGVETLKSNSLRFSIPLSALFQRERARVASATTSVVAIDCDRVAAHPADPFRVVAGVPFDKLAGEEALGKCTTALAVAPGEPRFLVQRARAYGKLGDEANNDDEAKLHFAAEQEDLKAAIAKGYPIAYHNLATAYEDGRGVDKDPDKAADLQLQFFNRVVLCCAVPAARALLAEKDRHDATTVARVATALLAWAADLGNADADSMLVEGSRAGHLPVPVFHHGRAMVTDLPQWFR